MSTQELQVSSSAAADAARVDFNFLAALAMPMDFLFPFPGFFLTLFALLTKSLERVQRYAIGIPRGFAKTTFIKVLCVWYVLFSSKQFILIIGSSEKKSTNILSDIMDMLGSPNIRRLFGHWDAHAEEDNSTTKVFTFRGREIILWAVGAGTSVRGINRKNKRPDVMIMDDIQDREDAKNKELADSLVTWMLSTLMKARSPFGCTYIFVGNMYPQNSILEKLKNNRQWTSLVVGGILADGSSLWEDLKPVDELVAEYESDTLMGHPEVFISEVLNSTEVALASGIDISRIPFLPSYYITDEPGEASFIIIDPSSGKKKGDDCTISHYEVRDGIPILDELLSGTFSPKFVIDESLKMGLRRNTKCIGVEGVAYQSTLLFWFEFFVSEEQLGLTGFNFVELAPKGQAKNNRIKRGLTRLIAGEIYLHPNIRSIVMSQIIEWNPGTMNNTDDIIDPIGYVEQMQQEYGLECIRNDFFQIAEEASCKAAHTDDILLPF
jgi:hypothetical protein